MKKWITGIALIFMSNAIAQHTTTLEWSFFHPKKSEWIELGKKGTIQQTLISTGEMPDPYYGTNELKFGWIEEHEWEFKSIFTVSKEMLEYDYNELVFNNIDTYGKVYLNDQLILSTDNAFIPHSKQVKTLLKEGINEITVVITPPVIYHKDKKKEVGYQLPAPNDAHEIAIAPYSRKPQYQFGWDWALRMNTIGFNKPVELFSYNTNRVVNKTVNVLSANEDLATLEFTVMLAVADSGDYQYLDQEGDPHKFKNENGVISWQEEIEKPKFWWPRGQGEQNLYNHHVNLYRDNHLFADFDWVYGIKTSELVREKDQWGTSYYFNINGRRIFCKGGDYIPQDIFPERVKDEDIVSMLEDMAAANFNMVRVWGGGYYPDDIFFETCDRLGLMVWQDFMFACSMYPGDDAFVANVTREFEYQVPRIAGHPSVVQFNGNNEVEVAWGNWGFQVKYGLYGKSARDIEAAYDTIFKQTAPGVVAKYSSVPYIHTSPLSNWGKMELYNHGSQHYWGVWHGKDPIEDFGKKIGRFNAEYGFQSFPEYSTLLTFSTKDEWDLASEVMKHHQKSYVGNDMILKHAKKLYGNPKSFEEFVYYSQLTQSMAVSMAVAGHRLDDPRCGGTLFWQVNDCWPGPTWSSIDYNGNWKALHYQMEKDYADISIVAKYLDLNNWEYYFISDLPVKTTQKVQCTLTDLEGKHLEQKSFDVSLNGAGAIQLDLCDILTSKFEKKNVHVVFEFTDHEGTPLRRTFDHIIRDYKKAKEEEVSIRLLNVNEEEKTAIIELTTESFLRNLWLSSSKFGVRFDRNFESVLPGSVQYEITFENVPSVEDFKLIWQ